MTSVSKWIPLLLVLLEVKLCCNFLPLGQKRGERWVWLVSSEESGLNAVFILFYFCFKFILLLVFFYIFLWHTSRKDCQPSFVQKKKKENKKKMSSVSSRDTSSFSSLRKLLRLGFIWRRNGVTTVQSSIMYKLLYSVFNRSSSNLKFLYLLHHILYQFLFQTPVQ